MALARPSGRRTRITSRTRVTVSPLSLTVVSASVNRTTALTRSPYFFCGCCARFRSQSGVPAKAETEPSMVRSRVATILILLRIGAASLHHGLLLVAGLHLVEETAQLRIPLQGEENAVEKQVSLRHQLRRGHLAADLVAGIGKSGILLLRNTLGAVAGGDHDGDLVHFRKGVRKIHRKLALRLLESVDLPGLEQVR